MKKQGQIFLNHAHVYPEDVFPQGSLQRLAEIVEICGIDRVVCFAPLPKSTTAAMAGGPAWLAQALRDYPEFVGFGTVDFEQPDLRDQVRRIVDLGLKGIKIHTSAQEVNVLGEDAFTVFDEAQKQGLPVDLHAGPHGFRLKWDTDPIAYDEIAYHFPELRMIIEHLGGWSFCRQMVGVVENANWRAGATRVYAGLTSSFGRMKAGEIHKPPVFTPEEAERALLLIGEEAAIVGMDFPWGSGPEQYQHDIQFVHNLRISEKAKQMLLGGNLARLLGEIGAVYEATSDNRK